MNKNSNQRKDQNAKGGKVTLFFKKNVYVILMIACIVAIATMITVAAFVNSNDDGPNVIDKPDGPIDKPDDGNNKPVDSEFIMISPIANYNLAKEFSKTDLVFNNTQKRWQTHEGIDLNAEVGTNVLCVFDGVVRSIESGENFGQVVTIDHNDGYTTIYKLLKNVTVTKGQVLKQGEVIGKVTDEINAEIADGVHLHFELTKDTETINPVSKMTEGDK